VAEDGLDEVDGRAAAQSVTGMGVAHPVGEAFCSRLARSLAAYTILLICETSRCPPF
jgi:hypothetical protein